MRNPYYERFVENVGVPNDSLFINYVEGGVALAAKTYVFNSSSTEKKSVIQYEAFAFLIDSIQQKRKHDLVFILLKNEWGTSSVAMKIAEINLKKSSIGTIQTNLVVKDDKVVTYALGEMRNVSLEQFQSILYGAVYAVFSIPSVAEERQFDQLLSQEIKFDYWNNSQAIIDFVIGKGGVILNVYGKFDDPDVTAAIIGQKEILV
ncbi:MAG: hypothetical protein ACRCYO_03945 [Bacteroidia bacterium]